jgi:hypothetical protein
MKRIIVVLMAVTSSVWANDYFNFLVNDSGQGRGDNEGNSDRYYSTNSYEIVTLDKNDSITINSYMIYADIDNDEVVGDSGNGQNWNNSSSAYKLKVVNDGITWEDVTLSDGLSVNGPGVVYISHVFSRYVSYGRSGSFADTSHLVYDYDYRWKIRYLLSSNKPEAKFSVSLDNDGDRVAMGYKESGSNALIRVYEFDGSSWNQLGEDIE